LCIGLSKHVTMGIKEKQIVVATLKPIHKRVAKRWVVLLVVAALLFLGIFWLLNSSPLTKANRSKQVSNKIVNLENSTDCQNGIKKAKTFGDKVAGSTHYTNSAREETLHYLMVCSFMSNQSADAFKYANQLKDLYKQDGNKQKQREVAQFITYMESYGQQ
jgi:hypothetical protein